MKEKLQFITLVALSVFPLIVCLLVSVIGKERDTKEYRRNRKVKSKKGE